MRLDDLTVALRPRSAWEAVELGTALVRRHAGAIWKPWVALSIPMLVLVNLLCWAMDVIWLAGFVMWWLKPYFDRVPLFVLSRAVFGQVPTTAQTLRAQWSFGRRWLPAYLLWRRLGPVRSLYLPVDLLEGGAGEDARARRRTLGSPVYGVGALLTLVFVNFELALMFGVLGLGLLFVPQEYLQDIAARFWNVLESQPSWLQFALNGIGWLATSALEPFYVGAGFGLYLNRRTEIEAWDIEIVLRRLRARLVQAAGPTLLVVLMIGGMGGVAPVHAQERPQRWEQEAARVEVPESVLEEADAEAITANRSTLREVFGDDAVDDAGWRQSLKRAYEDPRVSPKQTVTRWVPNDPDDPKRPGDPAFGALGAFLAMIGEYGLWIVLGIAVLVLALTSRHWIGWFRDAAARTRRAPGEVRRETHDDTQPPLPVDVPAAARALWQSGRGRDALALLYRASVEAMSERTRVALVPGATEAHTLRASRQLPHEDDRRVFARTVRTWQTAAYAHGLPTAAEFDELVDTLAQRFFTRAAGGTA